MKRHPSLHPLSEHHHHALVQALDIRRAAELPAADRKESFRRIAENFLRFWEAAGRTHFLEEEEILLPALAGHESLGEDGEVARMLADHGAIRAEIDLLAEDLATGQPVQARLMTLGQRLHDHVRLEEDTIFPRIEAILSEGELRAVGKQLTPLHEKKRPE